jgi:hypothetical protein
MILRIVYIHTHLLGNGRKNFPAGLTVDAVLVLLPAVKGRTLLVLAFVPNG